MTHLDPDPPTDDYGDARVAELLSSMTPADLELHEPPADLWAGIAARVAADPEIPGGGAGDSPARPVVVAMREPGSRTPRTFFAAAAAIAVLAGGVGTFVALRDDAPTSPSPSVRVLASAQLQQQEPLGSTRASAELVDEGGTKHLVIDASDMAPPPEGSAYELWLIDADVSDPRSLGTVTGSGDIVVPSSIDPAKYPIVDISLEPIDGDHSHSGHSLMRGTLQA